MILPSEPETARLISYFMEKALFLQKSRDHLDMYGRWCKVGFYESGRYLCHFRKCSGSNAIRAVLELEDEMKRVISVKIVIQNSILMIQIQNYYSGKLRFEKGLPLTTKKDQRDHGYGMKSIQYTAEKYNGTITVNAENAIFMLQILIPVAVA